MEIRKSRDGCNDCSTAPSFVYKGTDNFLFETRQLLTDVVLAVLAKDAARISRILARYVEPGHLVDVKRLASELHELICYYYDQELEDVELDTLFETGVMLLSDYKLVIPQQAVMLGRTAAMTESLVRLLSPSMSFVRELAPYIKQAIRAHISVRSLGAGLKRFTASSVGILRNLPDAAGALLEDLRDGKTRVECRHYGIEEQTGRISQALRLLALSVLAGALFSGACLLLAFSTFGTAAILCMALAGALFAWVLLGLVRLK